jgi:hypothetical protein
MQRWLLSIAIVVGAASSAAAEHMKFVGNFGLGSFSFRIGHGGPFDGGVFGAGLFGGFGTEFLQSRFEDRFSDLQAEYDEGVANIDDFYSSEDYGDVVDDAERLVDRYDWFVTGVERSIDHLDGAVERANESLTFYSDLLAKYQARDDLSEKRLARIEDYLTGIQDIISLKIDVLTDRQTALQENLVGYQEFQTGLTDYLDQIVAAGSGSNDDATEESALTVISASTAAVQARNLATGVASPVTPRSAATPTAEPATASLALLSLGGLGLRRQLRRRCG